MTLYVIRHGESESNVMGKYGGQYDTPLTAKGLAQARQVAGKLAGMRFESIVSSSLRRARQTAEIIQEAFGLPLILSDDFRERNMGVYEGLTEAEIIERYPDLWARRCTRRLDDAPTNGETYQQFIDRIASALMRLKEDHAGQSVLLVTHSFVARVIHKHLNGLSFDDMHGFQLANCEIAAFAI